MRIDRHSEETIDVSDDGIDAFRQALRSLSKKKFGWVPAEFLDRIDATTDLETLDRMLDQVLDVARPVDLSL